jgi:hypothetical protein
MVRLQVTSGADLEAFVRLRQRLSEASLSVPLSLCLPLALLDTLPTLPEAAKLITAPDAMLPEGPWCEQVRRGATLVARHGMGLEWMLTLETVPHFLRATYGATLEGLAYTASRLVELGREGRSAGHHRVLRQ